MLIDPVDRIVAILDELQVGAASLARLLGVAQVARRPPVTGAAARTARSSTPRDVRFSYVEGRDVLHGIDLDVGPSGSGSPWSGPPAPASRRWAGCSPASTRRAPAR